MKSLLFLLFSFSVFAQNQSHFNPNSCQLFSHCLKNDNPIWHKIQLGSDLADEVVSDVLNEFGKSSESYATISISSSGLDTSYTNKTLIKEVEVSKATSKAGDPNIDIKGDGTSLTGIILAKNLGLTRFTNVSVQRVNQKFQKHLSSDDLFEAIQNACKETDIVVLTWGDIRSDQGHEKMLELDWYKYASDNGCLLIKSMGLFDHIENFESLPSYSPLLTVSALDILGERDDDSNDAMLYAPAKGIYSLISSKVTIDNFSKSFMCSVNDIPFLKSFSESATSAVVASVASQVITILKAREILPKNPLTKLSVVKKILLAAASFKKDLGVNDNNLNAYIATLIAKNISVDDFDKEFSELYKVLAKERAAFCNSQSTNCHELSECDQKYECVNTLRKRVELCKDTQYQDLENLYMSLISMDEDILAYSYLRKKFNVSIALGLKSEKIKSFQTKYLDSLWQSRQVPNYNLYRVDEMIDVMMNAKKLGIEEFHNVENFLELITRNTLFSIDVYDHNLLKQDLTQALAKGKKFSQLYLSFNKSQRKEIVENLIGYYKRGTLGNVKMNYIFQMYSSEGILSSTGQKLRKLLVDITKSFLRLNDFKRIELSKSELKYILYKIPSLISEIKSNIKKPYIFVNKEIWELAFEYPEVFLINSKEEIAKQMLFEIFERKKQLYQEIKSAEYSLTRGAEIYKRLQEHATFIFLYTLHSKELDKNVVKMIKELASLRIPLNIASILVPSIAPFSDNRNHIELLKDEKFLDYYLTDQFYLLMRSMDLEGFIDPVHYGSYSRNIRESFLNNELFINRNQDKLKADYGLFILNITDFAIKKMKLIVSKPEYASTYQVGKDFQKYHYWKLSALIAQDTIVDFIKLSPSFNKINMLKGISSKFKAKIKEVYRLYELGEISLKEESLTVIKTYLDLKE